MNGAQITRQLLQTKFVICIGGAQFSNKKTKEIFFASDPQKTLSEPDKPNWLTKSVDEDTLTFCNSLQ